MDNVTGFKMMNGMEMIANLLGETTTHYQLENALYFELVELEPGKFDIQFAPLTFTAKVPTGTDHLAMNIDMPKSAVMFPYAIRDEIADRLHKIVSPIILLNK